MKFLMTTILLILVFSSVNAQQTVWKEFSSTEGGFSVLFPKVPTPNTMTVNTASGPGKSFMFAVKDEKFNDYLVAYSDSADMRADKVSTDKIFNKIRDGIVIASQGKLISEEIITLNGHSGRALTVERPDGIILTERIYLVDKRFYQLSVETKKSESESEDIKRFLNSFRLLATK